MFNRTTIIQAMIMVLVFQLGSYLYTSYFSTPPVPQPIGAMPSEFYVSGQSRGGKESFVRVETENMVVWLDKVGGRVARVLLKDYSKDQQPVSFFDKDQGGYLDTMAGYSGDGYLKFSSAKSKYEVAPGKSQVVTLQAEDKNGVVFTKAFTFKSGQFDIGVQTGVRNETSDAIKVQPYYVISGSQQNELEGNPPKMKDLSFDKNSAGFMGAVRGYSGVSYTTAQKPYVRMKFDGMLDDASAVTSKGGWLAFQKHHFLGAWVLEDGKTYKIKHAAQEGSSLKDEEMFEQQFASMAYGSLKTVEPGQSVSSATKLYVGPQTLKTLTALDPSLKSVMDYGFFWMIANILHNILLFIQTLVPNWSLSLIILTCLTRIVFYKSMKDQAIQGMKMKKMAPEKDAIEKRFADRPRLDPEKNEALVELYKKHDLKIMSFSMFTPFFQIPMLLAFYGMVAVAVEFRASSFMWMSDVSLPDPWYILPILSVGVMYLQSKEMTASEEFKMVARYMPVMFAFFVIKFPAALQLYILVNTGLGVLQNHLLVKNKPV